MKFQDAQLPQGATYVAASPIMNEHTVLPGILKKHMAPKGKCGYLKVSSGTLKFIWEDSGEVLDADSAHPIVIWPERFHHVRITGPVVFQIEFYQIPEAGSPDPDAIRPGEQFIG